MIHDPYKNIEPSVRLQSRVCPNDYAFIRSLFPANGVVQLLTNHLIKHLVETLKKHGITDYTNKPRLESLLESQYPLTGLAPADFAGRAAGGDVGGGTPRSRKGVARKQAKPSNNEGKPTAPGRAKRGPVGGEDNESDGTQSSD